MNFNRATIVGRLTHDPETKNLPSGQTVVSFSLATNRIWIDQAGNRQETTDFHNIVAFGKLAEICSRYLKKGQLVLVEGRIQTRSWEGPDGKKRYRTEIVASNMQMGPKTGGVQPETEGNPPEEEISQEDIPIVDAEEIPADSLSQNQEKNKTTTLTEEETSEETSSDKNKDGEKENAEPTIDVKDIPF